MKATRRAHGWAVAAFKSGLEEDNANLLRSLGIDPRYEEFSLEYQVPATTCRYTPDFRLPNGVVIETKGYFDAEDRKRHLLVRKSHPGLDIRFVFTKASQFCQTADRKAYSQWLQSTHKRKTGNIDLFNEWRATKKTPRAVVTYSEWCLKNSFQYAEKLIPLGWLAETSKETH